MRFEWDPAKAASNVRKHGISFDEAVTVFRLSRVWREKPNHEGRYTCPGPLCWKMVFPLKTVDPVFKDPLAFIFDDEAHSEQEHREIIIGMSALQRMVLVCFVERLEDIVRIISVRPATRQEIKDYEENARDQIS
jgi:hypothetical protein